MKTLNLKLALILATVAVFGAGCGSSSSDNVTAPIINTGDVPVSPDGVYTSGGSYTADQKTAVFTPVSLEMMNNYAYLHPLNDPKDIAVTIDLQEVKNGRYAGSVKISYTDNGQRIVGTFKAGRHQNDNFSSLRDNDKLDAEFNRWFIINGKYYFSAYFQDAYGGLIVVFDNYVNQGDAQGTGVVSGAVYFRNFPQSYATQSPYRSCWYIYDGPYDCRAEAVTKKNAIYPANGYRKLGTFSGLSKAAVFNN